ncbi:MAG TPA: sporulation integral membrane protein YlbJ [Epulopiscium sp.]|nr:sporulation integral membrane protein YlbJ [Candidatus Epulonipiscium sp.]
MMKRSHLYFLPLISMVFILALLLEPTQSIGAAKTGLLLWFNTVLPSLLPFIIGANILMASGSIYFFEKLFRPLMRPLFNVPGCCAFPWIMGLISGYPMGAKIAGDLYDNNQITDLELQRLLSFCNNSGPFFILGAVGVGMLGNEHLGYFLLLIHFLSSILVGLLFRFYGHESNSTPKYQKIRFKPANSIGETLGSSITSAMEVIVQIGGYIIIFSVIGSLLKETILIKAIGNTLYYVFRPLGMTKELAASWLMGIIEMSNGAYMVSTAQSVQSLKMAIVSFILGWGGLSVHAQSLNFIKKIAIKTPLYLFAKFLHGVIAFSFTLLFFPIYIKHSAQMPLPESIPTFALSNVRIFHVIGLGFIIFAFVFSIFVTYFNFKGNPQETK